MILTITDEEYQEYQHLKGIHTRELIQKSLNGVTRLEDDVDVPIKRCVMAFALMGCQPVWSCCGFDYAGQAIHKSHQYGRCYFILGNNYKTSSLIHTILFDSQGLLGASYWEISNKSDSMVDLHCTFSNMIPQWDDKDSLHYSEQIVQHIQCLEKWLMGFSSLFQESAVIKDTNKAYKDVFQSWQYPVREDWVITKEDLLA